MSLLADKIKMFFVNGVDIMGGGHKGGRSFTKIENIKSDDSRFEQGIMDNLLTSGFIETGKEYKEVQKEVARLVKSERESMTV